AGTVDVSADAVKGVPQRPAFLQTLDADLHVHVVAGIAGGVEGGVGGAEPARAIAEDAADADIRGQTGLGVIGATMARDDGAHAGLVLALAVVGGREIIASHGPVGAAARARISSP